MASKQTVEQQRLEAARDGASPWKRWGPYLAERAGDRARGLQPVWHREYFPHDHARARAYHWNEDGLAGISDEQQRLCFALALWNGKDSILKGAAVRPDRE